jgi:amino-acid N-acetyltransferase
MQEQVVRLEAEHIRSVLRYMDRFKNTVAVIHLDDRLIDTPLYTSYIRDIHLIYQAGLRVLIVPGARRRIDEILTASGISWEIRRGSRVTSEEAIPLIKMAAFDVSNRVMTALAVERRTAVIGNWVRARRYGVLDGVDYGAAGEVDKIDLAAVRTILDNGFIPIFPCIGWNAAGKPFNISSVRLATEIAVQCGADKLFFITAEAQVEQQALSLEETQALVDTAPETAGGILPLLRAGLESCRQGVTRSHILDGAIDGALPCEVFSDLGSGTMIYQNEYGGIRNMQSEDVPGVCSLMRPFVERGILLPRSQAKIAAEYKDYVVFELDGSIRACAALHLYDASQADIAALAVNEAFARMGTGPKLLRFLLDRARQVKVRSVFALTTQTGDWFEQCGFRQGDIATLPDKRRAAWNPARGSKLFRLDL